MSGVKGRSGRKKCRRRQIEEGMDAVRDRMPEFFQALAELAVGLHVVIPGKDGEQLRTYQKPPDREALVYLIDREYGKPRISLDQRVRSAVELDPDSIIQAIRQCRIEAEQYLALPDSCSEFRITERLLEDISGPSPQEATPPAVEDDMEGSGQQFSPMVEVMVKPIPQDEASGGSDYQI